MRRRLALAAVVGLLLAGCAADPSRLAAPSYYSEAAVAITTDNHGTPIGSFAVPAGRAALAVVRVVGVRDDGGAAVYAVVSGAYRNTGKGLVNVGHASPDLVPATGDLAGGALFDMGDRSVSILVMGPPAVTVRWAASWDVTVTP